MLLVRATAFGVLCAILGSLPAMAAESVGKATRIKTEVTGARGSIAVDGPIHRNERIRTSKDGLGQFTFQDGTKLAVGWGSSVVIDKFVYDDSGTVKKLSIKAVKGTFRWVSGRSKSSAYEIVTPAGTIGVRGTVFDFYVGPDGTTAMVLLGGAASFCGADGCKRLTRRCDCVVGKPGRPSSQVRKVDRKIFSTLKDKRALPFLSGNQGLSGGLGWIGGCGIGVAKQENNADRPAQPNRQKPERPTSPSRRRRPTLRSARSSRSSRSA